MSEDLESQLRADPFVRRYVERPPSRLSSPADVLGEQRSWALAALQGDVQLRSWAQPGAPFGDPRLARLPQSRLGVAQLIRDCVPFLWRHEMRALALAYTMPKHVIGDELFSHLNMWWTWETALTNTSVGNFDALILQRTERAYFLLACGADKADPHDARIGTSGKFISAEWIDIGARYPEDIPAHLRPVISMLAFMNSPYVTTEKRYAAVSQKKWHGRRIGDPQSLHVVALRAAVHEAVRAERGEGPQWKQRWLVRGHYRAQWYPATKTHKVIWIAPYIKGPDGAELKTPIYAVVR